MFEEFYAHLAAVGVVPVVVLQRAEDAVPLGRALAAGGLAMVEVTFRTGCAAEGIALMRRECPELLVGAGTVLDVDAAQCAIGAGAQFIVSPGLSAPLVQWCIEHGVPIVPGTFTPSEVMAARALGLEVTKLFPADQAGGPAGLKALSGPFPTHRFMPTGGVSLQNLADYLACPSVIACGGTWMAKPSLYAGGDFGPVVEAAAQARALAQRV